MPTAVLALAGDDRSLESPRTSRLRRRIPASQRRIPARLRPNPAPDRARSCRCGVRSCGFRPTMGVAVSPTTRAFRSAPNPSPGCRNYRPARCCSMQRRAGSRPVALDPSQLGSIVADRTDDEGREVVIVDGSGELHIRLSSDLAARRPMILLPIGVASVDLRLDVASRFIRRLSGQTIGLLPRALRLTTQRKRRLVQLLHAFDIHEHGRWPSRRRGKDPALGTGPTSIGRVERSHARRTANRLIHDSIALVERGYLKFLRGG